MEDKRKHLIVIVGPTAVGKTDLAVLVAEHFGAEIISADSRQFYREMNIGTAKPSAAHLSRIKHHFIDSHSVYDSFDVGKYEQEVLQLLDRLYVKNDVAVLVGGSGLFVKAVCDGLDEIPSTSTRVRDELNYEYKAQGLEPLLNELKDKDPDYFDMVDQKNPRRIIRALEVIRTTKQQFSLMRTAESKQRSFTCTKIGLTLPRELLYERIDLRMDKMLQDGLLHEAKKLLSFKDLNALQTVGYTELFGYLKGSYDLTEATRLLKRNSRRYAKRQLTWFKKDTEVAWFDGNDTSAIISHLENGLK